MRARPRSLSTVVAGVIATIAIAAPASGAPAIPVSAKPVATALSTKPAKTTIAVENGSKRRASGLTLSVSSAKGVTVRLTGATKKRPRTRKLQPLKAGRTARVGVSLRRTAKGPKSGHLTVKLTRKGKTLSRARLSFGPVATVPPKPGSPAPAPVVNPNTLAGRYFWGSRYTISGIVQNTLYFTGPDLVYVAATESAWPTCVAASETCRPYVYDAATNQLTIDGKPATLAGRKLSLDGDNYLELGVPAAGARWDTRVTYANSSGLCPLYCSYYTENLTFLPDGTFIRDAVSSGTGPVVDWASVPPDSKGSYEVGADHLLRLAFADGKQRVETVGLYLNDDGSLQAAGEGLVLGGDGYFDIRN